MLADAQELHLDEAPRLAVCPGLAILLAALAFNLLGDGLRDALDPEDAAREAEPLLDVRDLSRALRHRRRHGARRRPVSLRRSTPGEVLGVVGESGCGKSVTALSILRPAARHRDRLPARALLRRRRPARRCPSRELRQVRGREISFVFQEPMTSLNPVFTVGRQIGEVLQHAPRPVAGAAARTGDRAARPRRASRRPSAASTSTRTSSPAACASA